MAELKEFKHKTKTNYYVYANDPAKVQALTNDGNYDKTDKFLGYLPLDQFGFLLINAVM